MNITLKTNDGRPVATYETFNKVVRKEVNQETHQLKYPPAWTYDESIVNQVRRLYAINHGDLTEMNEIKFIIECIDTGKQYEISWEAFEKHATKMPWRQNPRYSQFRVPLEFWKETDLNRRQLSLFEDN